MAAAMGSAAEGLARKLSVEAKREPGLVVAVRPARMVLKGERYLPCRTLGNDLRDVLAERLEHERQRGNLGFQVQVVDAGEEAPAEVNTEWRHDERDGADVMRVTVRAKVGEQIIGQVFEEVPAARLTEGQKGCLMRWTACVRNQVITSGQPVIVWEEPGVGRELRKYLHNEVMDIRGDLVPIGTRESWQLV